MIIAAGLPKFLWAEAIHHSVWIGACTPLCALPEFIMPFEKATRRKPNLKGVLEWGVLIWVKRVDAGKLDPHAVEGCFVRYDEKAKGYHVYWNMKRSVTVECDVYVDKDAILEPGDAVFEGEDPVGSNPNTPVSQPLPQKEEHDTP